MIRRTALVFAALLALLALAAPAAMAGTTPPTADKTTIRVPMKVTGTWTETDQGVQLHPFAQDGILGDCGYSYVELEPYSGGFTMYTGFVVNEPAVDFSWNVLLDGPDFAEAFNDIGPLAFRDRWDAVVDFGVTYSGDYQAYVTEPSYALLANGQLCTSLYPSDATYVYF